MHYPFTESAMFSSAVLEVVIGLAFCYASLALTVTTLQEALSAVFRLRAGMLRACLQRMLHDPAFTGIARALYAHPLISTRTDLTDPHAPQHPGPSYIEPANFAIALIDAIRGGGAALDSAIAAVPDPQLRRTLNMLYVQTGGDVQRFQAALGGWFDSTMARLSGAYKRRQLLVSFLLALLLAILLNIDSIHLFQTLWRQPALAAAIGAVPAALDAKLVNDLATLPIGWTSFPPVLDGAFALQVTGWLITASTTLFGAPFWFDILQRAINLRSTGAKPAPVEVGQAMTHHAGPAAP
jgi:AcrR family transcriptional regulator